MNDGSVVFIRQMGVMPDWCVSDLIEAALPRLRFPRHVMALDLSVFRVDDPDACCSSGDVSEIVNSNSNVVHMHQLLSELEARGHDRTIIYLYVRPRSSHQGRIKSTG
jgi:hypothetical protein